MAVLLGRTTAGTTGDFNGTGHVGIWRFQASASGRAAFFFGQPKVSNPTGTVTIGAYADSAGSVGSRLFGPTTATAGNGVGPWSQDISAWAWDVVSGTFYWIGWRNSAEQMEFQGDTSGSYHENAGTADFPDPWGSDSTGTIDAVLWIEDAGTTIRYPDTFISVPFVPRGRNL